MEMTAAGSLASHPLYKEVKLRIMRGLAAGEWKAGEALPSETRLAERFSVSIGTVRKAVDDLVADKILLRHQGRGTFVATHTADRTLFYFFHIVGKDGGKELPAAELLAFSPGKADAEEASRLRVERGARVFRMRNILKLGGRPVVLDHITVPAGLFPALDEETFRDRDGTIYGLYQARYGINVIRISERLSAARASAQQAAALGIRSGEPVLIIRRVAHTYHDTPVEYRVSCVDTERHEYLSDLWKSAPPGAPAV